LGGGGGKKGPPHRISFVEPRSCWCRRVGSDVRWGWGWGGWLSYSCCFVTLVVCSVGLSFFGVDSFKPLFDLSSEANPPPVERLGGGVLVWGVWSVVFLFLDFKLDWLFSYHVFEPPPALALHDRGKPCAAPPRPEIPPRFSRPPPRPTTGGGGRERPVRVGGDTWAGSFPVRCATMPAWSWASSSPSILSCENSKRPPDVSARPTNSAATQCVHAGPLKKPFTTPFYTVGWLSLVAESLPPFALWFSELFAPRNTPPQAP